MSSNIRVQRICQHCNKEFVAKTTVTKYCGDNCAKRAYKARQRAAKIGESKKETQRVILQPVKELKGKEFLSITEACKLLGVSRWTVWRSIKKKELNYGKIGNRTIIRRSDVDKLFEKPNPRQPKPVEYQIEDCYTLSEIKGLYGISDKALYEIIKRNDMPKIQKGKFAYIPKVIIDKLFN